MSPAYAQSADGSSKLYELRLYTANAGKLADLKAVFRSHALPLFAKCGIENIFDGTVLEGAHVDGSDARNMLLCILAHQSRAAADRSWTAYDADADPGKACGFNLPDSHDFWPALEPPSPGSTAGVFN